MFSVYADNSELMLYKEPYNSSIFFIIGELPFCKLPTFDGEVKIDLISFEVAQRLYKSDSIINMPTTMVNSTFLLG